ncbi:MAG: hypothetical protein L6Q63_16260, partial [Giesbergeria sp.]|nr:hypothetical protein [Giesbergeria sp.]
SIPALIKCAISTCVGNALRVLAIPGLHQVLDGGRLSTNTAYYLNSIEVSGLRTLSSPRKLYSLLLLY